MTSTCPGLDGQLQKCGGEGVLEGLVTVKSSPEQEGKKWVLTKVALCLLTKQTS